MNPSQFQGLITTSRIVSEPRLTIGTSIKLTLEFGDVNAKFQLP